MRPSLASVQRNGLERVGTQKEGNGMARCREPDHPEEPLLPGCHGGDRCGIHAGWQCAQGVHRGRGIAFRSQLLGWTIISMTPSSLS